ncbi:hypothetical protein, partial [Paraburkholderia unamae]
ARSAVLIDVIDDEGACAAPLFLSDSLNLASSFNVGFTPALTRGMVERVARSFTFAIGRTNGTLRYDL